MFRRVLILLLVICAALSAGWLALRRADIPYEALEAKYADKSSRFLTLPDGLIVHYRDDGPKSAPTIVMLHGFASSLQTWDIWAEQLSQSYRVVRFDLPGHGLSRVGDPDKLTTSDLADFVRDVTTALDLDQFTLFGSSMGGHVAWTYATRYPEHLDGLVLVAASGVPVESTPDKQPIIFKLIRNPAIGPLLVDLDLKPLIRDGMEKSFIDQSRVSAETIDRFADLSRAPGHRKALLELATRQDPTLQDRLARLAGTPVPTLVMAGESDAVVSPETSRELAKRIPDAELVMFPQVGHLPQEEIPDEALAYVRDFLDKNQHKDPDPASDS